MQTTSLDNEFLDPQFDGEITSLPFAQILNDKRKSDCGFFITVENLAAADWQLPDNGQFHTATWGNGEESEGLLIQHPRLIILAQSPLLMFERSTGLNLGVYEGEFYRRAKADVVLKTKYLVYFVDDFNQPRHSVPMQLTMKGAAGASFGEHLRRFKLELEKAFAVAHNQPVKRKSAKFHAMGVFSIQTEPQQRGDDQKAWVCTTVSHEQPTQNNWLNYFVGFTSLKQRLWQDMDTYADFGKMQQPSVEPAPVLPQQPPGTEERELLDEYGEITQTVAAIAQPIVPADNPNRELLKNVGKITGHSSKQIAAILTDSFPGCKSHQLEDSELKAVVEAMCIDAALNRGMNLIQAQVAFGEWSAQMDQELSYEETAQLWMSQADMVGF